MIEKGTRDFDTRLFHLVHEDIRAENLLNLFQLRFYDNFRTNHRNMASILDRGTKLVAKHVFILEHYRYYVQRKFDPNLDFRHYYFHIVDQHDEARLELVGSILLARIGMINQAVNALRRAVEAGVYCSFFSTGSWYKDRMSWENPFVQLLEKGLWGSRSRNAIKMASFLRNDDVKSIISKNNLSRKQAELRILSEFTEYYLRYLCNPICHNHYNRRRDIVCSIPKGIHKKCAKCKGEASYVTVEYPITIGLMISATDIRLRKKGDRIANLKSLYSDLSYFIHPNPESHQHTPEYNITSLNEWLELLAKTVNVLSWLYIRANEYIGYREDMLSVLLDSSKYDLKKITLNQLSKILCKLIDNYINTVRK